MFYMFNIHITFVYIDNFSSKDIRKLQDKSLLHLDEFQDHTLSVVDCVNSSVVR